MIEKTLQHLIDQKLTSAREISELTGVSTSTVYRWLTHESQPDFNSIRLLLRHLPHRRAQESLIAAFTASTPWQCIHSQCETDVNNDGKVDAEDALDASIAVMKSAAHSLEKVREAGRDQTLTADETVQVVATLNHTINHCTLTQRILVDLTEQKQRRNLKLAR